LKKSKKSDIEQNRENQYTIINKRLSMHLLVVLSEAKDLVLLAISAIIRFFGRFAPSE